MGIPKERRRLLSSRATTIRDRRWRPSSRLEYMSGILTGLAGGALFGCLMSCIALTISVLLFGFGGPGPDTALNVSVFSLIAVGLVLGGMYLYRRRDRGSPSWSIVAGLVLTWIVIGLWLFVDWSGPGRPDPRITPPVGAPPSSPISEQHDFQLRLARARAALGDGKVQVNRRVQAEIGRPYFLKLRLCGNRSTACKPVVEPNGQNSEKSGVPSSSPDRSLRETQPMKVGARISVWITMAMAGAVDPPGPVVQLVLSEEDYADWTWAIRPAETGQTTIQVHLRVLLADTDIALEPDRIVDVAMTVDPKRQKWHEVWPGRIWRVVKDFIGWFIGMVAALGIGGALVARILGTKRKTRTAASRDLRPKRRRWRICGNLKWNVPEDPGTKAVPEEHRQWMRPG
jgi:hypothetical protein